eukprot:6389246-Prorocentrum_lima.AAC.1
MPWQGIGRSRRMRQPVHAFFRLEVWFCLMASVRQLTSTTHVAAFVRLCKTVATRLNCSMAAW